MIFPERIADLLRPILLAGAVWMIGAWNPPVGAEPPRILTPTSQVESRAWRYTNDEPSGGWWKPGFDDSTWSQGEAPFARPGTPGLTPRTEWLTPDIWLRRTFGLAQIPDGQLVVRIYHDEGAEVYINGAPALEVGGWTTGYRDYFARPAARAALKRGENTLAVHCHQTGGGQGIDVGLLMITLTSAELTAGDATLRFVVNDAGEVGAELRVGEAMTLRSLSDGLWSIGTGWENEWPAEWHFGAPAGFVRVDDWIVLTGSVDTPDGRWDIRDSYRAEGDVIRCVRRWTWRGEEVSPPTTLAIRWEAPDRSRRVLAPGILYHGNPSGAASRESGWRGVVPVWLGEAGERGFYEEHRYPAPYISFEWPDDRSAAGFGFAAALHTLPSPAPYGQAFDQWWSLGAWSQVDSTELALLSGPLAFNGVPGVAKAGQTFSLPYENAHIRVPPGRSVEKTCWLQAYPIEREGAGFQRALPASIDIHEPFSLEGLPPIGQILKDKYRFALSRWRGENEKPGFAMYPHDRDLYVMGWAGQSEAPGYALLVLADELGDPEGTDIAKRCLDSLCEAPFNENGFLLALNGKTGEWSRQDPISQGQAMTNFARAIKAARKRGVDTSKWETFLERACDMHAASILHPDWRPVSTNEGFLIAPLCLGYELFGKQKYAVAAITAAEHYGERHLTMNEPYWGGTLDANCEDKEGAWAAFEGFLAVYEMTGEKKYLDWAEHACDVTLTYTVLWDVAMPPGRLADHGLKTHGWTSVSVQNMHLDVFGVLFSPEVYRIGQLTGRDDLKRLAVAMYRSAGQMIDPWGSQGEQLQHTFYTQGGDMSDPTKYRGDYVEDWTVFWITAHFLNAAAKFDEMGVLEEMRRAQ